MGVVSSRQKAAKQNEEEEVDTLKEETWTEADPEQAELEEAEPSVASEASEAEPSEAEQSEAESSEASEVSEALEASVEASAAIEVEVEPQADSEVELQGEPEAEPEAEPDIELEVGLEVEPKFETQVGPEVKSEVELGVGSGVESGLAAELEPGQPTEADLMEVDSLAEQETQQQAELKALEAEVAALEAKAAALEAAAQTTTQPSAEDGAEQAVETKALAVGAEADEAEAVPTGGEEAETEQAAKLPHGHDLDDNKSEIASEPFSLWQFLPKRTEAPSQGTLGSTAAPSSLYPALDDDRAAIEAPHAFLKDSLVDDAGSKDVAFGAGAEEHDSNDEQDSTLYPQPDLSKTKVPAESVSSSTVAHQPQEAAFSVASVVSGLAREPRSQKDGPQANALEAAGNDFDEDVEGGVSLGTGLAEDRYNAQASGKQSQHRQDVDMDLQNVDEDQSISDKPVSSAKRKRNVGEVEPEGEEEKLLEQPAKQPRIEAEISRKDLNKESGRHDARVSAGQPTNGANGAHPEEIKAKSSASGAQDNASEAALQQSQPEKRKKNKGTRGLGRRKKEQLKRRLARLEAQQTQTEQTADSPDLDEQIQTLRRKLHMDAETSVSAAPLAASIAV